MRQKVNAPESLWAMTPELVIQNLYSVGFLLLIGFEFYVYLKIDAVINYRFWSFLALLASSFSIEIFYIWFWTKVSERNAYDCIALILVSVGSSVICTRILQVTFFSLDSAWWWGPATLFGILIGVLIFLLSLVYVYLYKDKIKKENLRRKYERKEESYNLEAKS
jgi:hypothetical protein